MPKTIQTTLLCAECGKEFKIMRRQSKQRGYYHIKHMYCPLCKNVTKHLECKDLDLLLCKISFKEPNKWTEEEKFIYQLVKKENKNEC